MLKPQTCISCSLPVLSAGVLSVKLNEVASSCGRRSPTPPGKCSAEETGAKTDPHLTVSVAQRTSAGCSLTAQEELVDCRLHRSGLTHLQNTVLNDLTSASETDWTEFKMEHIQNQSCILC